MPNYTQNRLVVKGDKESLIYFYEKNRVNKEDVKFRNMGEERELSFEMSVPIGGSSPNHVWGTKWDAQEPSSNLTDLDEEKLSYSFDTAWNYPHKWLDSVSRIFPTLEFEITYTNEDDEYDIHITEIFKDGMSSEVRCCSRIENNIEEYGVEELISEMIEYLDEEDVKIKDKGDDDKEYPWRDYCRKYLESTEPSMDDRDSNLFYHIANSIYIFLLERELHPSIYKNKKLCNLFFEKVKSIL